MARYEGIANLPGVQATGWVPGVGMPFGMGGMGGAAEAPSQSLFSIIDDRMRGRWTAALLVGVLLAAIAATVGYLSAEPIYVSTGTIEVQRDVRFIYRRLDDMTGVTGDYDRFVATQVQRIRGATVIGEALQDEKVKALGISKGMMRDGLSVEPDRQSQLIYVEFEAEDARVAEAAVNAVLEAYERKYAQQAKADIDSTLNELEGNIQQQERAAAILDEDIRKITTKYNSTDLAAVQKGNQDQINLLRLRITEGKHQMGRLTRAPTTQGDAPSTVKVPPMAALLKIEPTLSELDQQMRRAQFEFEGIKSRYQPGAGAYDTYARNARLAEDAYQRALQSAIDRWRKLPPEALLDSGMSEAITSDDIALYEESLKSLEASQRDLVTDITNLEKLRSDLQTKQKDIQGKRDHMNSIALEIKPLNKVITIDEHGALPELPSKDQRRTRLLMGLALGFAASFGMFFLLGTLDRRAFGASQLGLGGNLPPCLGVLPDLGKSLNDPETSDVASHCVHQIRNQIEAVREPLDGYVMCISSPFQGDGKTSIVMALGWSYAAAGYNTLVIDCDLIGRSLTRQLGLSGREGLREALIARQWNGSVSRLPWANLSAVPVGVDARFGPENIRRMDLERLIDQVRDQYDIILIDTGPLLGSLESTPVTAAADGVILSVRRGRSRGKLEDCVSRLKMVGTPCIGVILNCAQRSDCNRYVSEASLAAAEEERSGRAALPAHAPGERNALVRAVQSTTRPREDEPADPRGPEERG